MRFIACTRVAFTRAARWNAPYSRAMHAPRAVPCFPPHPHGHTDAAHSCGRSPMPRVRRGPRARPFDQSHRSPSFTTKPPPISTDPLTSHTHLQHTARFTIRTHSQRPTHPSFTLRRLQQPPVPATHATAPFTRPGAPRHSTHHSHHASRPSLRSPRGVSSGARSRPPAHECATSLHTFVAASAFIARRRMGCESVSALSAPHATHPHRTWHTATTALHACARAAAARLYDVGLAGAWNLCGLQTGSNMLRCAGILRTSPGARQMGG